jgi:acyl carrier protein
MDKFILNFKGQFEEDNITINLDSKFRDLDGWDSMTALMVIAMLDELYNCQIDPEEFKKYEYVYELYDLIK